jgi:hypothetical protein
MAIDRPVTRRAAVKALGVVTLLPLLSEDALAALAEVQRTGAAPALKVLTADQYRTVEALVEAILPADERSPGAKEARVADYIDLLLSESASSERQRWLDGLAALERESSDRFGRPLLGLEAAEVDGLLAEISRHEQAKEAAVGADPGPPQARGLLGDVQRPRPDRTPLEVFFADTKQATIHGYYTSELGIHKELRYKGNTLLAEFVGCETAQGRDCPHCGQKAEPQA